MIQADYYIRSGDVKRVLIIGAETLSRIYDPYDRDSMIYSDGAGAAILEARESETPVGILSHKTRSDTLDQAYLLRMGASFRSNGESDQDLYMKMDGHKLYQYALRNVPGVVKESLDKAECSLDDIQKVFIHQANAKMDQAILKRIFKLYERNNVPDNIMPMTISWLGNSSVATIPTLLDLVLKGKMENHTVNDGDHAVLASVGAGMNINSMVYRFPGD